MIYYYYNYIIFEKARLLMRIHVQIDIDILRAAKLKGLTSHCSDSWVVDHEHAYGRVNFNYKLKLNYIYN